MLTIVSSSAGITGGCVCVCRGEGGTIATSGVASGGVEEDLGGLKDEQASKEPNRLNEYKQKTEQCVIQKML